MISDVSILRDTIENVLHDQASNNKPFAVGNCAYVKKRLRNSEQIPKEYEDSVLKCDVKHKDGCNLRESPRLVEIFRKEGDIDSFNWINSPKIKQVETAMKLYEISKQRDKFLTQWI